MSVLDDPSVGPYDGIEDTLVGVLNNSSKTVSSLPLSSNTDLFGFDGDGPCTVTPAPSSCPFGPTGYEGPIGSFSNISPDTTSGTVNFKGGLAPGASTFFALEERLTASQITVGAPPVSPPVSAPVSPPVSAGVSSDSKQDPHTEKLSKLQKRQKDHSNQGGFEDDAVEGSVLEVRCDLAAPRSKDVQRPDDVPYAVIANRDGSVQVRLFYETRSQCKSIRPGDYLQVDGVKQNEQLFDAENVSIERGGKRVK